MRLRTFAVCLCLFAVGRAFCSDMNFKLTNKTGRSFEAVYISSARDPDWNGNLLPDGVALEPNATVQVEFDRADKSAIWDLNVVDDEGLAVCFKDINLINVDTITLKTVSGGITAEVE